MDILHGVIVIVCYSHHYLTGVEPSGGSGASFDILSSQVEDPPAHLPKEV